MAARAIWQGEIHLGKTILPVKFYSAWIETDVRFHLLHAPDQVRLQQRMVRPDGAVVEREEVRKGFPVDAETILLLDERELDGLAPADSRTILVERFIPRASLGFEWFDRPYYLGPGDGHGAECQALAAALQQAGRCGIARWVMRKRQYAGALFGDQGRLIVVTLNSPTEVVAASGLKAPPGRDLSAEEKKLAARLVESLSGTFKPDEFHDTYQAEVAKLVESKRAGRKPPARKAAKRAPAPKSLEAALRRSVESVSRSRGG